MRRLYTSREMADSIIKFCRVIGVFVFDIKPLHSTLQILDPDTDYKFGYGIDIQMPYSKLHLLDKYTNRKVTGHIVKIKVRENFNVFFVKGEENMRTWQLSQPIKCHYRPH